jgi:hypothetical protein
MEEMVREEGADRVDDIEVEIKPPGGSPSNPRSGR